MYVLLYNGPLLCGFNVPVKRLTECKNWTSNVRMYRRLGPSEQQRSTSIFTVNQAAVSLRTRLVRTVTKVLHEKEWHDATLHAQKHPLRTFGKAFNSVIHLTGQHIHCFTKKWDSCNLEISCTVVSLLQWNLARDIPMALATKRVGYIINFPPHLSYVFTLPEITQKLERNTDELKQRLVDTWDRTPRGIIDKASDQRQTLLALLRAISNTPKLVLFKATHITETKTT